MIFSEPQLCFSIKFSTCPSITVGLSRLCFLRVTSAMPRFYFQIVLCVTVLTMPKIAVILSGCGVYDGTEVHEAAAALAALSRAGAQIEMFAPDADQAHVVDHTKGAEMEPARK